jgi:tetratricopeptide (TPR) repeat protein
MLWGLPSHFGYDLTCYVFTGNLDVGCWTDQFKPTIRIFSTLGQPNWLAAYLVIHLCLGAYFYLKSQVRAQQWGYGAYMVFVMVMLLFTRSRSALLAAALAGLIIGAYLFIRREAAKKRSLQKSIGLLIIVLAVPFLVVGTGIDKLDKYAHIPSWFGSSQQTKMDMEPTTEGARINITDSSSIRRIVWQGAYSLGMENPLFGTGVETFAYAYNFVRPVEHNTTSEWDYVYNKAHNEVFNYFATTGFFGLLTYLAVFGVVILHLRKAFDGTLKKEDELLVVILIAAYVSIFITNFFGFSTSTVNVFYYLIPAWIAVIVYRKSLKQFPDEMKIAEEDGLKLVIPVCIVVVSTWYVAQYFRADKAYAYGDGLFSAQQFPEALPYLYDAFNIRREPVYADKISQIHAQQAYTRALSGEENPQCLESDGSMKDCIRLAEAYNAYSIQKSSKNTAFYRTQARNNFIFFQIGLDEKYYQKAIKSIDLARTLSPTDPRLPYLRGLFALGLFETKKSPSKRDRDLLAMTGLGSVEFALELKEDYTSAYYLKGLIQKAVKDTDGARKTFQYILDSLDPKHEQARQELQTL